jgi:hypothetical protein
LLWQKSRKAITLEKVQVLLAAQRWELVKLLELRQKCTEEKPDRHKILALD